ncbi:MAG: vitamin K epoxide reductase family protein [Bacteroidetes bacterium]|nr:vitamin K epoxide reductase family protein [Bacteroidota bacterium]
MVIETEETDNVREDQKMLNHHVHHRQTVWMHFANFFLGVWLIAAPLTFIYNSEPMVINDFICGFLICLFTLLSINPFRLWAPWAAAIVGLWLNVAPLIFWAPEAVSYNNDTIIGILVIAFAIVAPGVPGVKLYEEPGPDVPPGWSVNPSSWIQRIPIIFLGWIGFFASRYLAAYQLGYINTAWDPFFGEGTENVLNSDVSKAWPVSDAGLGAFSYMLDAMMGYLGGENRWRTMPWAVIFFGILIIPLGAISITLIILQPLAVGSWCSICLFTAIVMLIMIPCSFDEVFASIQFLRKSKKEGKSVWRIFWLGGTTSEKSIEYIRHDLTSFRKTVKEIFSDFSVPWNLILSSLIGVWLMFSPFVFGHTNALADSDHFVGALIITFSVIAMGEIIRPIRFINIASGLWIMLSPFLLAGEIIIYNELISGFLLIILSFRKGKIINNYGSFNKYIV